jgi:hypothetical protein
MISRRDWLRLASVGVLGGSVSGWMGRLAAVAPPLTKKVKSCILLWMNGGPSTIDMWDLKVGHKNGGPFKEVATASAGLKISEHLPQVAKWGKRLAVIRSMTTKEGDHGRATHYLRTGYFPGGGVPYPTLGSFVSKELGQEDFALPKFVSVAPYRFFSPAAYSAGFLGPMFAPLVVGESLQFGGIPAGTTGYADALKVVDLEAPKRLKEGEADSRVKLLGMLDKDFADTRPDTPARSHKAAYERAVRLMKTEARKAFNLDEEKPSVRDAYGRNLFGQGCLLARRLVERGVPFVEVNHGGNQPGGFGWDTHADNFNQVRNNCGTLDPAWARLMSDLQDRGMLDSTLIVWMGEFGRTPNLVGTGRDHYPNAWSAVLAGANIIGGQAYGATSKDGTTVEKDPVTVPDLMATIVKALGIDVEKANNFSGRPIRMADRGAKPIREITG